MIYRIASLFILIVLATWLAGCAERHVVKTPVPPEPSKIQPAR